MPEIDYMTLKPGDEVIVYLNDKPYVTVIDDHGVQRFKVNTIVDSFMDANLKLWDTTRGTKFNDEVWTLNQLGVEYHKGKHTLETMIDFYTAIGYSCSGFCEISYFVDVKFINPLWDIPTTDKISSAAFAMLGQEIGFPDDLKNVGAEAVFSGRWKTMSKNNTGYYIPGTESLDQVIADFFKEKDIKINMYEIQQKQWSDWYKEWRDRGSNPREDYTSTEFEELKEQVHEIIINIQQNY